MGRLVKNPPMVLNAGIAASALLPGGATAERPTSAEAGRMRWSTTNSEIEFWNGSAWATLPATGTVTITKDQFTGDAIDTTFTMTFSVTDETDILVFVGGVFQNPGVAYTNDGSTTITFTSPPPDSEVIVVLHGLNEVS